MSKVTAPLSLVQEAEQARQVVNVLARLETRISDGRWSRGYRFGPDGGNCLIGAIDEACGWVLPGVAEKATAELASRLPMPFRAIGRVRPRLALASFNDTVGGRQGALALVRETRYALGGLPLIRFGDDARPQPWVAERQQRPVTRPIAEPTPKAAAAEPDVVIDLTDRWVANEPLRR